MNIGILGPGAYGLALANIIVRNNHNVTMWSFDPKEKEELTTTRKSPKLKDYIIPQNINITNDMEETVKNKDLVIIAVPAFSFETTIKNMKKYINKKTPVVVATKGIQNDTCLFLNEVFENNLSNKLGIISGPTFADDMVKNIPVGLTIATKNVDVEKKVRRCFQNESTKFRRTEDIIGVEVCASIKNVMAIASGMLEGMNALPSTKALFLTEITNDIKELITKLGGKEKTILSFAGIGDIIMTCTSTTSRNYSFGVLLGKGASKKEIDEYLKNTTVEGMYTLQSIYKLIHNKRIKMPIINLIKDIIEGKKEKEELLKFLITK